MTRTGSNLENNDIHWTDRSVIIQTQQFHDDNEEIVQQNLTKRNGKKGSENFYRDILPIIRVARFFGIFLPVGGNSSSAPATMIFDFKSFWFHYCMVIVIALFSLVITSSVCFIKTIGVEGSNGAFTTVVFFGNNFLSVVFFIWLPPQWIKLQQKWALIESQLNGFNENRSKLRRKFTTISLILLSCGLFEHILYIIDQIICYSVNNYISGLWTLFVRAYNLNADNFNLSNFNFTSVMAMFYWILGHSATFIWNFTDLFIIMVSIGLAENYKSLNTSVMNSMQRKHYADIHWHQIREKYASLSYLVKQTDSAISPLIFLSYSTNLYFIWVQLFNGISLDGTLNTFYFFTSVGLMIGRTIAVTLSAASINDQSKVILPALYCCPGSSFTRETKRLQVQLTSDEVALTGLKLFSITRNFIIAIAGAIATYEVVFLQFNAPKK